MDFSDLFQAKEYSFLREDEHLGRRVILLGISGSRGYGTESENSDVDLRGITLNRRSDLIGLSSYEQFVDEKTDTVIYAFNKVIPLLLSCNPNTMELLGLCPEHYLFLHEIGKELIERRGMFLSKRAAHSFGGYADAQLRRLQNALARDSYPQSERERHILNSVKNAMRDIQRRYQKFENGGIRLYIDKAVNPAMEEEIFVDLQLEHYPLRDYKNIWNEMNNIVKSYDKLGHRNRKKDDEHLNKHAMHLVRLFMTSIDILEKGEIRTYRKEERELLKSIRRGDFQKEEGGFRAEFYDLVREYQERWRTAADRTELPDEPDMRAVEEFVMQVNERVVRDAF